MRLELVGKLAIIFLLRCQINIHQAKEYFVSVTETYLQVELFYNDCKVPMSTFRYFYLEFFSSRWSMENIYKNKIKLVFGPNF